MKNLFNPIKIGNLEIPNRFMHSATNENLADTTGKVTDELIDFYKPLAEGEIGIIIPGYSYVLPDGKSSLRQSGIYSDEHIVNYKKLSNIIKANGSKAILQIVHGGRQSTHDYTGLPIWVPTIIENSPNSSYEKELDDDKINEIIEAFIKAAERAKEADFDGVQLHVAHGFLLSNFISPYTNHRNDKWGGTTENRCRIVKEIILGIKKRCGLDFPVGIKINSEDGIIQGMTVDEGISAAIEINKTPIDFIEVSGGIREAGFFACRENIDSEDKEAYFRKAAKLIRNKTNKIIALVGGIRSLKIMQKIIDDDIADIISLCRPFIRETNLIKNFKDGKKQIADCISCNKCFVPNGIKCIFN